MAIQWVGSPNFDTNRNPVDRVVIHWFGKGNQAAADAQFQKTSAQGGGTSAHYSVEGNSVHQYVKEENVAYHAGNYAMNQRSIGIEHSAEPDRPATDETYEVAGKLLGEICRRHNIALDRSHILKHSEIKATQCPGTMDLDRIINIAKQGGNMSEIDELRKENAELKVDIADKQKNIGNLEGQVKGLIVERDQLKVERDAAYKKGYDEGYAKGKSEAPTSSDESTWRAIEKTDEYVENEHKIVVKSVSN